MEFLLEYGYIVLFVLIFLDQVGLPLFPISAKKGKSVSSVNIAMRLPKYPSQHDMQTSR